MKSKMACSLGCLVISMVAALCPALPVVAQPEKSRTATYVKVHAIAEKPNAVGQQIVTVVLDIDDKYFLIGNMVSEDLEDVRFQVKFLINGKPANATISYPPGNVIKEKALGQYTIYEGKPACKATVQPQVEDTSPIEIAISMQGYPKTRSY